MVKLRFVKLPYGKFTIRNFTVSSQIYRMVNLRIVILPYGKFAIANLPYGNFTIRKFTVIGLDIEPTSNTNTLEPLTALVES